MSAKQLEDYGHALTQRRRRELERLIRENQILQMLCETYKRNQLPSLRDRPISKSLRVEVH